MGSPLPARLPQSPRHSLAGPAEQARIRHLETTGGWTGRERLRILWYRLRLTVQEMNYATRRMTELQTCLPGQPLGRPASPSPAARPGKVTRKPPRGRPAW
jgi:hypothetical protein